MSYITFPKVSDIINGVSQDIRTQLSATAGPGQAVLVDYTNRVHKQVLRFSRWAFLLSEPQYFITEQGQSQYWVGPVGTGPSGTVDTQLNLLDVDKFKKDSVVDLSNMRGLKWLTSPPYGPNLSDQTGSGRPGLPATYQQNPNDPNVLAIYPPPNNENTKALVPAIPIITTAAAGALAARSYLVKVTLVDQLGGESTAPTAGALKYIVASNLATVKSPAGGTFGQFPVGFTSAGVLYNRYNVYAVKATLDANGKPTNEGSETLQNGVAGPISVGVDWTEPGTGLITTGASVPQVNTLQTMSGYIIKFQYYKNRLNLTGTTQPLQVPDDYIDVMIQGVQALAWKLLEKPQQVQLSMSLYRDGLREMIRDKNLFPEGVAFMRPDSNTFVNQQILGYLPPSL